MTVAVLSAVGVKVMAKAGMVTDKVRKALVKAGVASAMARTGVEERGQAQGLTLGSARKVLLRLVIEMMERPQKISRSQMFNPKSKIRITPSGKGRSHSRRSSRFRGQKWLTLHPGARVVLMEVIYFVQTMIPVLLGLRPIGSLVRFVVSSIMLQRTTVAIFVKSVGSTITLHMTVSDACLRVWV